MWSRENFDQVLAIRIRRRCAGISPAVRAFMWRAYFLSCSKSIGPAFGRGPFLSWDGPRPRGSWIYGMRDSGP